MMMNMVGMEDGEEEREEEEESELFSLEEEDLEEEGMAPLQGQVIGGWSTSSCCW